jgi:hypothetical protein
MVIFHRICFFPAVQKKTQSARVQRLGEEGRSTYLRPRSTKDKAKGERSLEKSLGAAQASEQCIML